MSGKTQEEADHSEIAGALREMMKGFEAAGVIDGRTTHDRDGICLTQAVVLSSEAVGAICDREQVPTCPASVAVPASHR